MTSNVRADRSKPVEDDEPEEIRVAWAELFFDLAVIVCGLNLVEFLMVRHGNGISGTS